MQAQVHLPTSKAGSKKGFALLLFADPSQAVEAFQSMDGATFQGRLLHIIPADAKREAGLDEFALSKLPLKKQNMLRKKAEAASNTFNWNSLYMNQDAVNTSVANRLGVSKSELLDPTSSDAAVKQAIAETSVIQETKAYFVANGVDLEAFKSHKRGDTAILVKNFPHGTTMEELRTLFEEGGPVLRVLMPPSGTIAIVEYAQPNQAKAAFGKLAYRRIKDSVLFLEKAPKDLFTGETQAKVVVAPSNDRPTGTRKLNVDDLLTGGDKAEEVVDTTSLFVRNLNFETTTSRLAEACSSIDGFVSARVKTKADPKKPGQTLSMGFGFVEFRSKVQAQEALKVLDGYVLDNHTLSVKASHRGLDAAEERRRDDRARKAASKRTKIIIKNLPFQATKKDVRALFGTYGQLRSVRVPKKADYTARGFAFADFVTPREAENALNALRDTHLLGRKLVLDYAEAEALDAEEEIEKMQRKVGGQANKMALQQLTGGGRQKVNIGDNEEDGEG
jgi:multiple RNA-binding domain-containing protein 1